MSAPQESARVIPRLLQFLRKPFHEKSRSFYVKWARRFPNVPIPIYLSFGVWWVGRNDTLSEPMSRDDFEKGERLFVERFLKQGMTVLDIGAHHGLYTLLAAKRVGRSGRVIAFEPSPREIRALRLNILLNHCRNVTIEGVALGRSSTMATLYVVQGIQTGCNSLRPPIVISETSPVEVLVVRLDDWARQRRLGPVDFIKLDVEGGELAVLEGAGHLLLQEPRPVILAEVQDLRTRPWGYSAKEILRYLCDRQYRWFRLSDEGTLAEVDLGLREFEGNFIACPRESIAKLTTCL